MYKDIHDYNGNKFCACCKKKIMSKSGNTISSPKCGNFYVFSFPLNIPSKMVMSGNGNLGKHN